MEVLALLQEQMRLVLEQEEQNEQHAVSLSPIPVIGSIAMGDQRLSCFNARPQRAAHWAIQPLIAACYGTNYRNW